MKIEKILNIMMWVLIAVSAFLMISFIASISDDEANSAMDAWLNTNLTWTYILLIVTIILVVLFSFVQTFEDKKSTKGALVLAGATVVIFGISYMLASDEIPQFFGVERFVADGTLTNTVSKWIDTTLIVSYILFVLTTVATLFWSVSRIFSKK